MARDLQKAIDEVETTYKDLVDIANDMTAPLFEPINDVIKQVDSNDGIYSTSMDNIRTLLLKLSLQSYTLSETKDKAGLKEQCAETLRKEAYAKSYALSSGTVAQRETSSQIAISEEILVEAIYELVSASIKTKLDEVHRVVDTLKSILMSRVQEMKMTQNMSIGEVGERTYLVE